MSHNENVYKKCWKGPERVEMQYKMSLAAMILIM